jgi:hypothetical protein
VWWLGVSRRVVEGAVPFAGILPFPGRGAARRVGQVERAAALSGRGVRTISVVGGGAQIAMPYREDADRSGALGAPGVVR